MGARATSGRRAKSNGHDPASAGSLVASAPPRVPATLALDVGEQIRRLQALAELRAAGVLTDGELADLKRRVLSSGSDAPLLEARHAGTMQAPQIGGTGSTAVAAAGNGHVPPADTQRTSTAATGVSPARAGAMKGRAEIAGASQPVLDRHVPKGRYVTALKVVGTKPITWRAGSNTKRPLYLSWKKALHAAAAKAAAGARPMSSELFSLRIELRLPGDQGSDLDNYVKPIRTRSPMRASSGQSQTRKAR